MSDRPPNDGAPAHDRPSLIVFAYACLPGGGSEPGAGWGMVMALRTFSRCTVLVRSDHAAAIGEWASADHGPPVEFVEVAESAFGTALRRGRLGHFAAYLLWLRRARRAASALVRSGAIDGAVHVTYSPYWLPTPAVSLGVPSVLGPIGGGVVTPRALWGLLGRRGVITEVLDLALVRAAAWLPATRRTWERATTILVQNEATRRRLPSGLRDKSELINHTLFHEWHVAEDEPVARPQRYVLWVSPMESRKGPELAIAAMASARPGVPLLMVGDGPERARMEALAARRGLEVRFTGRVSRAQVLDAMRHADVVLFTGMREEGGLALGEAMLMGCPIIVLDNGGAGSLARRTVDRSRVTLIPVTTREGTVAAMASAIADHCRSPRPHGGPLIDQEAETRRLASAVLAVTSGAGSPS